MKQRLGAVTVAILLGMAAGSSAEERISSPLLGPMSVLTTGVHVAQVGTRDVVVWHADGVRLSVIDENGVPSTSRIVAYTYERRPPQVIAVGDKAHVFWTDQGKLHRRIFDSEGDPVDEGLELAAGVDYPVVARSGSVTGVMVEPYVAGSTFTGSVLLTFDDDGHEIGRRLIWGRARAFLAPLGSGFVTAQWSAAGISVKRLSVSGQGLDPLPIQAGASTNNGVLVSSGDLAWVVTRTSSSLRLVALDVDGRVTVSREVQLPVPSVATNDLAASARADGLVVLIGLDDDVYRMRFGTNGAQKEPATKVVSGEGRQSARAVSSGSRELAFWSGEQKDIHVQQDGQARLLTIGGSFVETISVAASDERILVAWRDRVGAAQVYRYAFLDPSGRPLGDPVAFDSSEGLYEEDPQVAWSGNEFGLLWKANYALRLMRFGGDGAVLGEMQLPAPPDRMILAGGHGRLVGLWRSNGIMASELGESGAGPAVTLTTPIPPPPHVSSGDGSPFLLVDVEGFRLAYENTFYYDCVGIPCPEETSIYIVDVSKDLVPDITTRTLVAQDTRVVAGAVSGNSAGLLTSWQGLNLQIAQRAGDAATPNALWERTGSWPMLGGVAMTGRENGFAVVLGQRLDAEESWTSIHQVAADGTTEDVRVVPASRVQATRLVRVGSSEIAVYIKALPDEGGGRAVFTDRWQEAPAAPAFPSVPMKVKVHELTSPFVEVSWEYEGPPVRAFTISTSPQEITIVLKPDSRSHIFATLAKRFRVVAINEAGAAASSWVGPRKERVRGVRR